MCCFPTVINPWLSLTLYGNAYTHLNVNEWNLRATPLSVWFRSVWLKQMCTTFLHSTHINYIRHLVWSFVHSFHFIHSMRLQIKWIVRKSSMHCNGITFLVKSYRRERKKHTHITFYYMNNKSDRWHNHNLLLIFIKFSSSKRIVICGTPDEKPSNCIE